MRQIAVVVLLLVVGCAATPSVPISQPSPTLPPAPSAPVLTVAPAASAVVKKFDAARQREPAAVLGGAMSAEQIDLVRRADQRARSALTQLGRERHHPTEAALNEARRAVKALEDALSPL